MDTTGAVNRPAAEIVPALALQVTAELKFPVPVTVAEHWLVWLDWMVEGEHATVTDVMVPAGVTVTIAVPDFVASCVAVAVIVTAVLVATTWAVNRPAAEIVPAFALQVTAELKFPVPVTVAEHWLVWPD